ncbi:MAG: ATPase, T2SS/T4P/T4SS family, partial [Pygmaiobacter sp.]
DIHISVGIPPVCRVNGQLTELCFEKNTCESVLENLRTLLTEEQLARLVQEGDLDVSLAYGEDNLVRMRLAAYRQRGSYSMALRVLNQRIPSFEELGLPRAIAEQFCMLHYGLVLVTGPTGTGKTTSISAMIDWINHNRSCHVITAEDPIEYFHRHDKSMVHQREIGTDTKNFSTALREALRQDPDVLFIGEM